MNRYLEMARDILAGWSGDPAIAVVMHAVIDQLWASGFDRFAVLTAAAAISDDAWAGLAREWSLSFGVQRRPEVDEATLQRWIATIAPQFAPLAMQGGAQ